eukprot:319269-Chlamydomonas_euryale.AAC.1
MFGFGMSLVCVQRFGTCSALWYMSSGWYVYSATCPWHVVHEKIVLHWIRGGREREGGGGIESHREHVHMTAGSSDVE